MFSSLAVAERNVFVLGVNSGDEDFLMWLGGNNDRVATGVPADDKADLIGTSDHRALELDPVAVLFVVWKFGPWLHPWDDLVEGVWRVRARRNDEVVAWNVDESLWIPNSRDVDGSELRAFRLLDVRDLLAEAELDVQFFALVVEICEEAGCRAVSRLVWVLCSGV